MTREPCEKCGGKGRLSRRSQHEDGGSSIMAFACTCVRDLPAIDGKATWWESETIYRSVLSAAIFDASVDVSACCEIPRNDDGRRVHRTAENAYYPPMVEIDTDQGKLILFAEEACAIAAALTAAADACEKAGALAVKG